MERLTLIDPLDMHLHLREGETLKRVLPYTANLFSGAVAMPNLKTPLCTTQEVLSYKKNIEEACPKERFTPFMTLFFHENLTLEELTLAQIEGIRIIKLYPKGSTTGSEAGVAQILTPKTLQILEEMQSLGLILSMHGESGGFVLEREFEFLSVYEEIARTFPKLQIIIEHMSDARSLERIERFSNLYGTLTLHHLLYTLDDLLGGALNPHLFCKPVLKLPRDREALQKAALSAHPKISFGSDSAPHPKEAKESAKGAAGIFSAPLLLPLLAELFERHGKLENLQAFVSDNAHRIYGITPLGKRVTLLQEESLIEEDYAGFISPEAGKRVRWRVESSC